jgi:limonene-1,2-epoxide hydrolase
MRAMSNPESVVRDFCAAFSKLDITALLEFFAEDAVYHNIPIAPVEGKAGIEATLKQFLDPNGSAEFEIRNLASRGSVVLTERVDRFNVNGKQVELPVMGTFEVGEDGKITAWRDYFDLAQFTKQLG